jgi:hypothetical protein
MDGVKSLVSSSHDRPELSIHVDPSPWHVFTVDDELPQFQATLASAYPECHPDRHGLVRRLQHSDGERELSGANRTSYGDVGEVSDHHGSSLTV